MNDGSASPAASTPVTRHTGSITRAVPVAAGHWAASMTRWSDFPARRDGRGCYSRFPNLPADDLFAAKPARVVPK